MSGIARNRGQLATRSVMGAMLACGACSFAGGAGGEPDADGAPRRADAMTSDAGPDGQVRVEACGVGYVNGYLFGATRLEWTEARTLCEGDGATLVTINSDAENTFVNKLRIDANAGDIWLGANDRSDEGDWEWPDGQDLDNTYERWEGGEPNDGGWFDAEDCAVLRADEGDRWNDTECDKSFVFACECSDSVVVP